MFGSISLIPAFNHSLRRHRDLSLPSIHLRATSIPPQICEGMRDRCGTWAKLVTEVFAISILSVNTLLSLPLFHTHNKRQRSFVWHEFRWRWQTLSNMNWGWKVSKGVILCLIFFCRYSLKAQLFGPWVIMSSHGFFSVGLFASICIIPCRNI